jgi:hypothetical protein
MQQLSREISRATDGDGDRSRHSRDQSAAWREH